MTWWQAILLGTVQGLGEFLPISSSGHIMFFEQLLNMQIDPNAMMLITVLLHVGTLLVIVIVFWKDWVAILKNLFHSKTLLLLIIASLPALIVKLGLKAVQEDLDNAEVLGLGNRLHALNISAADAARKYSRFILGKMYIAHLTVEVASRGKFKVSRHRESEPDAFIVKILR